MSGEVHDCECSLAEMPMSLEHCAFWREELAEELPLWRIRDGWGIVNALWHRTFWLELRIRGTIVPLEFTPSR